jgi:hypothetical protein
LRGPLAARLAGVENPAWLDQQHLHLVLGVGLVLHSARHHEHLAGRQLHRAIAKIDAQHPIDNDERLIRILVVMPDKIPLQLDELELVVVHFRDHSGLPLLADQRELFHKIDCLVGHANRHSLI